HSHGQRALEPASNSAKMLRRPRPPKQKGILKTRMPFPLNFADSIREPLLRPYRNRRFRRRTRSALRNFFCLRPRFADVDAALEEGAVFNRDARRHHVPGQRTVTADITTVAGGQVAAHFAEHYD